jgi:hypothetical protein
MSFESTLWVATDFIAGGHELDFYLFGGGSIDDAFWDVSAVPQAFYGGPVTEVEIVRVRVICDAGGQRSLVFTVKNPTPYAIAFTRTAVRIPSY